MHEIHLNSKSFEPLQEKRFQYILGANGLFLAKDNAAFRAVVKVEPGPELMLEPMTETLELKDIKISFFWMYKAVTFFREVYKTHGTEGFLWILLDPESMKVSLWCPPQKNHPGHVHAKSDPDLPTDCLVMGDIHSHTCKSFHSNGDIEDEKSSDGLHIVVGNLNARIPDFTAGLVVKGRRKKLNPQDVMELDFGFDSDWITKVDPPQNQGVVDRLFRRFL